MKMSVYIFAYPVVCILFEIGRGFGFLVVVRRVIFGLLPTCNSPQAIFGIRSPWLKDRHVCRRGLFLLAHCVTQIVIRAS